MSRPDYDKILRSYERGFLTTATNDIATLVSYIEELEAERDKALTEVAEAKKRAKDDYETIRQTRNELASQYSMGFRRGAEAMRQECYEAWAKLRSWQEHETGERILAVPLPSEDSCPRES